MATVEHITDGHNELASVAVRERAGTPASEAARGSAPHRAGAGGERKGGARGGAALRSMAYGSRPPTGVIPSRCWRSRVLPGCRSSCPSATGGCWCRRSPSSAARPIRWRPTWPAPRTRAGGAALRRCASVQLRWVRRARSAAGVRHQRLRRDAPGAVRVGRQTAGGQLCRGRAGSGLRREAAAVDQPGGDTRLP